ncbi:hypothetical protein [Thioalkalivibrio sp. ALMg11]|uniref:hypothetical protein n=1 Tax=Thioalkalivibrio sp. ALMg11 TaxID=1158165 RepID=UPI00035C1D74|nr:hypothetical protein [Thioalkalivibrio sp. ALMg11]
MRFSRNAIYGALLLSLSPLAHAGAFEEGRAFSSDMGRQEISTDAAAELPDAEGDTSQQRGYFQGGQGSTTGPGTTRVLECDAQGNDDPECNAINFMNQNPTPDYPVSRDDPLLEDAKEIRSNAESIAGPDMDSEAECVTTTVSGPDMTVEQSCDVFRHGNVSHCDVERVIEVDREVVYQCDDGYSMDEYSCSQTLEVEVEPACSPGEQFADGFRCDSSMRVQTHSDHYGWLDTGLNYGEGGRGSSGFRIYCVQPIQGECYVSVNAEDWRQSCSGGACTMSFYLRYYDMHGGGTGEDGPYLVNYNAEPTISGEAWVDGCSDVDAITQN